MQLVVYLPIVAFAPILFPFSASSCQCLLWYYWYQTGV